MNLSANSDARRISTVDAAVSLGYAGPRLRILMLADDAHPADAVLDHIRSFQRLSHHHVTVLNPINYRYGWVMNALRFDVILIHYSICILYDYYLPEPVAAAVSEFPGPKVQIVQDEMRWIDRMTLRMSELGIDAVFSSLSPDNIARVYHHAHLANVRFYSGLPGYVSERLHRLHPGPLSARPFHLVYRGRPLPVSLGKFSQEKVRIGVQAMAMAEKYGLRIDCKLGEEDRVYGSKWNKLLMTGRAALATEGGATVFDFDESVEKNFADFRENRPGAGDDEIWEAVVRPYEGNVIHKTITPRVLEAVMCRTALVMYPGEYRGILQPREHYIPLERDGSNEAEVVEWLRDDDRLEQLVERAYERVAGDPALQFAHYVTAIDCVASQLAGSRASMEAARSTHSTFVPFVLNFAERRASAFDNPHTLSYRVWNTASAACQALAAYRLLFSKNKPIPAGGAEDETAAAPLSAHVLPARKDKLNVLILCDFRFRHVGTIRDHLEAFRKYCRHTTCIVDAHSASKLDVDLDKFDAVVLHYTLIISMPEYLPAALARKIQEYNGYKVLFIQDEYRWVDRTVASMAELGIDLIYTVVNEDAVERVYHHPSIRHVRRKTTLTGFVSEELTRRDVPDFEARRVDIGYRARRVPAWLGGFSREKWLIGQRFKRDAEAYALVCDIEDAESRRLYGEKWISFVSGCKAVLGTESGASFIDFSGEVQPAVEAFERGNPGADFSEISKRFLNGDGDIVIRVISPRCFEAAALRTLMILYPGSYSGALEPWRHYVPLERGHANMDDVVAVLRDPERAREIIDNAYRDVALNPQYSFKAMVKEFDRDLDIHASKLRAAAMGRGAFKPAVPLARSAHAIKAFERQVKWNYLTRRALVLNIRQRAYKAVNWTIVTVVPEDRQALVRHNIKTVARRLGMLRSQG